MLGVAPAAKAAPEFAPNPRQSFEGFAAINPPRTDVPIGALWIDGFGPSGAGASTDNLETVRSLNSLTIDKNLQVALSVGLLDFLGIDPKLRDHYVARFSDLSIVRVKDTSKLPGVRGEPRIVEALKAGSVTVSSDSGFGLNARTIGFETRNVSGSSTNDRARIYAIEARDMFIAIRVATPELIASFERELKLSKDARTAKIDDYQLLIGQEKCEAGDAPCRPAIRVSKVNTYGAEASSKSTELGFDFTARLQLPVPVGDGRGGLYDSLLVRWVAPCSQATTGDCRNEPRLFARYAGTRLTNATTLKPKTW